MKLTSIAGIKKSHKTFKHYHPKCGDLLNILYVTRLYRHPLEKLRAFNDNEIIDDIMPSDFVFVLETAHIIRGDFARLLNINILFKNITGWITVINNGRYDNYKLIASL